MTIRPGNQKMQIQRGRRRAVRPWRLLPAFLLPLVLCAQQPAEPVDNSPIDGESYTFINQLSGLQMDLDHGSSAAGGAIVQQSRSFTSLSQRWALTRLAAGGWAITNLANGLCLDSAVSGNTTATVQNPCTPSTATQQWTLTAAGNGYNTVANTGTGLLLDLCGGSAAAGAALCQSAASSSATQSQQWLLRPAFFRGVDNALLEKQEADRLAAGSPWWQDAGQPGDVLQILKNHGVNMIRIRPASTPPYQTYTLSSQAAIPAACSANGCYAETDSADLDLAKRAKKLGLSIELTLFFDGGSSTALPGAWSGETLAQAQTSLYNYVKSEVEAYRAAGAMPDMITLGNEVDTGFFGALASPTGSNFAPFAALQIQGMQAILDAASDPSLGAAIPAPLRCIHITPAWDLSNFFAYVNSNAVPYDAVCQSYYPFDHGPLTAAQATASNPSGKPVEQTVLTSAANNLGKPIFLIEVGEHYENGFAANDPWYPASVAGQRQFLIDVNTVLKNLPDNLGLGMEYWDAEGVNTTSASGASTSSDGLPDATYAWNGLTLFDNADTTGATQFSAANYSAVLAGLDALGGKLDSSLAYKLVNVASGEILGMAGTATANGAPLNMAVSNGSASLGEQWSLTSNGDGFLQIANLATAQGAALVLDNNGSNASGSSVALNTAVAGDAAQEWNLVTAGGGNYTIVNKASGLVLTAANSVQQQTPASTSPDWIAPVNTSQLWQVIPVHMTAASAAAQLGFAAATPASLTYGSALGSVSVNVEDSTGALVTTSAASVTLTVSGPGGFSYSASAASVNGEATFNLSTLVLNASGSYTLSAASSGLTSASAPLTVGKATLTVTAQNATRGYGAANPAFTYAISGWVNGDTQAVVSGAPVLSSSASGTSAPGAYPITVASGTLAAANYVFTLTPGTLTVTTASTSTSLAVSATTVNPGTAVNFTATVTSSSLIAATGSVNFMAGSSQLGSAALNASGVATLSATVLPGSNSVTAVYAGNADFASSTSSATLVTEPDFAVTANSTTLTVTAGSTGSTGLVLTPVGGYAGAVAMSCSTLMAGVSCSFTPASYTLNGSNTVQTGTVSIAASTTAAALHTPIDRHGSLTATAAICWLPGMPLLLLVIHERKRQRRGQQILLLLALLLIGASLTACGGGSGSSAPPSHQPVTGSVTITAAGSTGSVTQTVPLTVTVD